MLLERIGSLGGLRAFSSDDFARRTIEWYFKNTGIPISFGTVVLMGIIVGIAIAGQTFYLFIHENIRFMAALKAMGAGRFLLIRMVTLQAFTVGFTGYGLGVGLAAGFGNAVLKKGEPPFYMPWQVLVFSGAVILLICIISALVGVIKVISAEAAKGGLSVTLFERAHARFGEAPSPKKTPTPKASSNSWHFIWRIPRRENLASVNEGTFALRRVHCDTTIVTG